MNNNQAVNELSVKDGVEDRKFVVVKDFTSPVIWLITFVHYCQGLQMHLA